MFLNWELGTHCCSGVAQNKNTNRFRLRKNYGHSLLYLATPRDRVPGLYDIKADVL